MSQKETVALELNRKKWGNFSPNPTTGFIIGIGDRDQELFFYSLHQK